MALISTVMKQDVQEIKSSFHGTNLSLNVPDCTSAEILTPLATWYSEFVLFMEKIFKFDLLC